MHSEHSSRSDRGDGPSERLVAWDSSATSGYIGLLFSQPTKPFVSQAAQLLREAQREDFKKLVRRFDEAGLWEKVDELKARGTREFGIIW